jgi:urease gamma subunit
MSTKQKLPRATLEQKIAVLDFYHERASKENEKTSQADVVKHFKDKISISTSSFSEWVKNEDTLRALYNHPNSAHRRSKRKLKFKYEEINAAMDQLVQQRLKEGKSVTEPFLREHWVVLANRYGVEDPKRLQSFSHGWLSQFKKRHKLDRQSREKERQDPRPQQLTELGNSSGYGALDEYGEEFMQNYETLINNQMLQPLNVRPAAPQQLNQGFSQQVAQVMPQPFISETDFEMFLEKYGEEFMSLSQEKYPESAKLFTQFVKVFKREREFLNERRLRELIVRR